MWSGLGLRVDSVMSISMFQGIGLRFQGFDDVSRDSMTFEGI